MIIKHASRMVLAVFMAFAVSACHVGAKSGDPTHGSQTKLKSPSFIGSYNIIWTEGENYRVLSTTASRNSADVDVVEFFQYGCGHCYALEPWVTSWALAKPSYVNFMRVPVTYKRAYMSHAKLFYALKELGRIDLQGKQDLHHEVFDTIHRIGEPLVAVDDDAQSESLQEAFCERFGINKNDFRRMYSSAAVSADVRYAQLATDKYQIQATPTFVVGGRYVTDAGLAGGSDRLFILVGDLVQRLKNGAGG